MKQRVLCFLAAVLLLLPLLPAPVYACDYCDDGINPREYVKKGYVAPQVGVPGYSGDLCCPKCGAVLVKGKPLPAKEAEPTKKAEPAKEKATTKPDAKKTKAPEATKKPASQQKKQMDETTHARTRKQGRERFSAQYPYRRVRMHPAEGIRAEGAGVLVWPVPATPFRTTFGD